MARPHPFFHLIVPAIAFLALWRPPAPAADDPGAYAKLDTTLVYVSHVRGKSVLGRRGARLTGSDGREAAVDIVLSQAPGPRELAALAAAGARVTVVGGRAVVVGRVVSARVAWSALPRLTALAEVTAVESAHPFGLRRALDVSVPETHTAEAWARTDLAGIPLTGTGMVVADIDSGIDVFHPTFWRADGPRYSWIDVNQNGRFDPGVDAVDLNRNGVADPNERLDVLQAEQATTGRAARAEAAFDPKLDWLYNDANQSGRREFGTGAVERLPTFGERVFVVDDANGNGRLDPGEALVQLGSCKIRAVMSADGTIYQRGVDLSQTPADAEGHGTSVCGIIAGGQRGFRRYVGLAPDAELLVANPDADPATAIAWAESEGARVICHPYGDWVLQFMDGSSALEQMLDTEAEKGIVQVVAAGNLAGSGRVAAVTVPAAAAAGPGTVTVRLQTPSRGTGLLDLSALWRTSANHLQFLLAPPDSAMLPLSGDAQERTNGSGLTLFSRGVLTSPRGTARFDVIAGEEQGLPGGVWTLRIINTASHPESVRLMVGDDGDNWADGAQFLDDATDDGTVSWPATADRAIVVGSYSSRGIDAPVGSLSFFSGRGRRIDGRPLLAVAAPGHFDIFTAHAGHPGTTTGGWEQFSGTSASCPHVAAACALFLQRWPVATTVEVAAALRRGARADAQTGPVPNDEWGAGKLNVLAALEAGIAPGPPPDTWWVTPPPVLCTSGREVTVRFDGSDPRWGPATLSFAWRLEPGGHWSDPARERMLTVRDLPDGRYTVEVRAVNPSGAVDPTPAGAPLCIDRTPPQTRIDDGPSSETTGPRAVCAGPGPHVFRFSGTDTITPSDELQFSWRLDGSAWSEWSSAPRAEVGPLAGGPHRFEVRARDIAGNVDPSPAVRRFRVDAAGPTVRLTAAPHHLTTGSATLGFEGTDDWSPADALQFSWRLDGPEAGAWSLWQTARSVSLSSLAPGSYRFQVRARDAAGNVSAFPAETQFTVGLAPAVLAGTVRDSHGTPLRGASIEVILPDGSRRETTTDRAGRYRVGNLPAALATVAVSRTSFLAAQRAGLALRPGRALGGVDLVLRRPASLVIMATDPRGRALAAAAVTVSFAGGGRIASTTTKGAAFAGLPPGAAWVAVTCSGYQPRRAALTLGEGSALRIRLKLRPAARPDGR